MSRFEQVSRRIFIRDFGRGVLGISIGGGVLAACSTEADSTTTTTLAPTTTAAPTTTEAPTTTAVPETTTTTEATTTTTEPEPPPSTIAQTEPLTVERMALGNTTAYLMIRGTEVALVDTGGGDEPAT